MKIASPNQPQSPPPTPPNKKKSSAEIYHAFTDKVQLGAATSVGVSVGYVAGALAGCGVNSIGGNIGYTYFGPYVGAAIGGMAGIAAYKESEGWGQAALTVGLAAGGTMIGDALGHGLTAMTGNGVYAALGAAVGGLNGGLGGLNALSKPDDIIGQSTHYALPTATGFTVGTTAGVLAGALLSSITGSGMYNTVAPILGAAAGSLTGLALAVNYKPGHFAQNNNHNNDNSGGDGGGD